MANLIQIKRGLKSNLPTLSSGEPGWTTDNHELFIGDGVANYQVSMHHEYGANTILKADLDNTPTSLTVTEDTLIGRQSAGNISPISPANVLSMLSGTASSDFSINNQKITSLGTPTSNTDATTKSYVDDLVSKGLTAHEVVLDKDVLDPTTLTPSEGDRYWIAGTGAVGTAWEGHNYEIVTYESSAWVFEAVTDGDMAFVDDESLYYFYDANTTSLKKLNTAIGNHASTHESGGADPVDHDNLTNFVANEHVDHTSVSISTGGILSGGGDLTSTRTISLNHSDIDHDQTTNYAANEHIDWTTDQGATNVNDANITKTAITQNTYTYADLSLAIDDTAVDGQTAEPISSNWAYDHTNATTGIHGVTGNVVGTTDTQTLTNKTIDGGTFV